MFGFISNLWCGFYLCLPFGISVFLFPLASSELIFPPSIFFPSISLKVTNSIFILLVATLEITCTLNLSKPEINQSLPLSVLYPYP